MPTLRDYEDLMFYVHQQLERTLIWGTLDKDSRKRLQEALTEIEKAAEDKSMAASVGE